MTYDRYDLTKLWGEARRRALKYYVEDTIQTCENVKVYPDHWDAIHDDQNSDRHPAVTFLNNDTISAGIELSFHASDKVAVLNFDNGTKAGGGGEIGATAQEESLCRSSNLYESLVQAKCIKEYYQYNGTTVHKNSAAIIYSPAVLFFRAGTDYHSISPIKMDVITCAASEIQLSDALQEYERRIKNILASSIDNGVKNIVLGAWGCGAFNQDPVIVSKAFCNVLNTYGGYFDHIVFAIIDNQSTNYTVFKDTFDQYYEGETREIL